MVFLTPWIAVGLLNRYGTGVAPYFTIPEGESIYPTLWQIRRLDTCRYKPFRFAALGRLVLFCLSVSLCLHSTLAGLQ